MKYKTYPKMKDSRIDWVGDIPEEWQVPSVSKMYDIQLGKMLQPKQESEDDLLVFYLKADNVHWEYVKTETLPKMWANPFEIQQYGIKQGDLLVCEGGEGGRCAILSVNIDNGIIQNALHRVRSLKNSQLQYLTYFLIACGNSGWFDVINNKATIAHFTREKFASLKMSFPSTKEQKIISKYLDKQISKIDSEISKNKILIKFLKEKRRTIIDHALTKGTDPTVPTRDSEVEWIGDIPQNWNVVPIKHISKLQGGNAFDSNDFTDKGIHVLKIVNVSEEKIDWSEKAFLPNIFWDKFKEFQIKKNDIVIAMTRPIISHGLKISFFKEDYKCLLNQRVGRFLIKPQILPSYLFELFCSQYIKENISIKLSESVQPNISSEDIENIKIPLPPKNEQNQIIDTIRKQKLKIDFVISKARLQIGKLQEFRQSLILSTVTGKICVTN